MRLDAPLMSFGAPMVDNFGVVQDVPALSMLTGLLGNALGYEHGQWEALDRLQERLHFAVCRERTGEKLRDFQTVDFSQGSDDLKVAKRVGWTTRGRVEERAGSNDTLREKHIRHRDYWADALYRVALTLDPAAEAPTLDHLATALAEPERPLFIGRKPCLPSGPLLEGRTVATSLVAALEALEPLGEGDARAVWWEEGEAEVAGHSVLLTMADERDWRSQLHGGQRLVRRSILRRSQRREASDEQS